jgi:hypothetical protein
VIGVVVVVLLSIASRANEKRPPFKRRVVPFGSAQLERQRLRHKFKG